MKLTNMKKILISKIVARRVFYFAMIVVVSFVLFTEIKARKFEDGYAAFNKANFKEAHEDLYLIAMLGDSHAQQLLSYMYGLGLGRPIDFGEAIYWMKRTNKKDRKNFSMEEAYYLGIAASDGLYGENKKELGNIWLRISCLSLYQPDGEKKDHAKVILERCIPLLVPQ